MKTEITYTESELEKGKCTCCNEVSEEILINDGRCVDCIADQAFYDETMKGL